MVDIVNGTCEICTNERYIVIYIIYNCMKSVLFSRYYMMYA